MFKRLLIALLLLAAASSSRAIEYTDVYWVGPAEDGWGFFLVQSNTTQFLAFFIYGSDGKPIWYVAILNDDGTGKYTGDVFATTGTYFPQPWNAAEHSAAKAGTATFQPVDSYHATLTYTITGTAPVIKAVQRQTLTAYVLGGNYSGSMSGSITGCVDPADNEPQFRGRFNLSVTQAVDDSSASMTLSFVDSVNNGTVCTVSGPLAHFGRLYRLNGQMSCTGPTAPSGAVPATIEGLHPTGQGIEGKMTSALGGGCNAVFHFSAVLNVNN